MSNWLSVVDALGSALYALGFIPNNDVEGAPGLANFAYLLVLWSLYRTWRLKVRVKRLESRLPKRQETNQPSAPEPESVTIDAPMNDSLARW